MKKTIISIIGIAVMLLAITACRPNYVIVPIPGGGTSSTPSGTPVSDAGELQEALAKGEDVYLTKDVVLPEGFQIPENSTIDGDDKTITVPTGTDPGTGIMDLAASGVTLKNVTLDFTAQSVTGASLLSATARAAGDKFAVLIGSGDGNMDNAPSGITLSNVTIKTGGTIAGINVHTAKNVTLEDITIDYCQKAPISISSSTVTIDGIKASLGSAWYEGKNIIQINGVGGNPNHKPSTVTFESTEGIDGIWMEAVEDEYVNDGTISDENFQKDGQSVVNGLPSGWAIRYSNQPSKKTEGWMFYAPGEDASTFTLNEKAADSEADLIAMLEAVASSEDHKYSTIKLASNIDVTDTIIVTSKVTLDLNGMTLSNTEPIWVDVEDGNEDRWSIISVRENGDLTITGDGKIDALEKDCYAFDVVDGSHLVIENGEFIGNVSAVYVNEGKAEINGGKYSIKQLDPTHNDERFLLNLLDANREAGTAEIVVTGGTFVKFDPEDNLAEGKGTNFVAEGYASTYNESDKTYTVNKK